MTDSSDTKFDIDKSPEKIYLLHLQRDTQSFPLEPLIIKPDAVSRNAVGAILKRVEDRESRSGT